MREKEKQRLLMFEYILLTTGSRLTGLRIAGLRTTETPKRDGSVDLESDGNSEIMQESVLRQGTESVVYCVFRESQGQPYSESCGEAAVNGSKRISGTNIGTARK